LFHACRWEKFSAAVSSPDRRGKPGVVAKLFPFSEYFADAPQPLFKPGASYVDDMEVSTQGPRNLPQTA
jgi:intron-binding protein aquarius